MRRAAAILIFVTLAGAFAYRAASDRPAETIILATTTSVQDSGLLDALLPAFTRRTGIVVKPVAVGSGEAIGMARRGAADAVLAHSPADEERLVVDGVALDRRPLMRNSFLVVGPPDDPARVRDARSAREAFERIAAAGRPFVSRGDRSGTHARELALWRTPPAGAWYVQSGAGMGETLLIADEKGAYTLTDLATYLAFRPKLRLETLFEGGEDLLNRYSVMRVRGGAPAAARLVDFFTGAEGLGIIGAFGRERHGRPLFVPEGGRP